jgi:hypothetical protein
MSMDTLAGALRELAERGYRDQFRAEQGRLRATKSDRTFSPDALAVDEVARFEGDSNPAEQSLVFALRERGGEIRGTYTVAYGPEMDPADAAIVEALERADA